MDSICAISYPLITFITFGLGTFTFNYSFKARTGGAVAARVLTILNFLFSLTTIIFGVLYYWLIGFIFLCVALTLTFIALIIVFYSNNIQRQRNNSSSNASNKLIDEIKELKNLLDCGALTQEEYDAKKQEILFK